MNLIRNIHDEINHRCVEDTRKEMKKRKIIYRGYGYVNDINNILSRCITCLQKNKNYIKRNIAKTIIFNYPKDHYV